MRKYKSDGLWREIDGFKTTFNYCTMFHVEQLLLSKITKQSKKYKTAIIYAMRYQNINKKCSMWNIFYLFNRTYNLSKSSWS